jgi:S1-C subfamily serine protease
MLRRLASVGVVSLALGGSALSAHDAWAQAAPPVPAPAPATVPTAKKVVTTPPAAPPAAALPPASPAPAAAAAAPAAPNSVEKSRQGVVVLERQGKPLALGVVLDGDGRILTALSPLTNGNFLSVRYADGVVTPLKLVHSDRGWDLALLSPVPGPKQAPHKSGLRAARTPSFVGLQTFNLAPPSTVAAAPAALKLSEGLLGGDNAQLVGAYELGQKATFVGGPVVNTEGEVVALVARACPPKSAAACVPAPYGAPVSALKQFLQRVPTEAAWLGVEAASDETGGVRGVRVISVVPNSPAASAGVRPGNDPSQADLIVAVDGTPVTTTNELNEAMRSRTAGDSVELLLYGLGRYRNAHVKPRPAPQLTAPPYVAPKPGKPRVPNPYR